MPGCIWAGGRGARAATAQSRLVELGKVSRLSGDFAAERAPQHLPTGQGGWEIMSVGGVEGVQAVVAQLQLAQRRLGAGLLACAPLQQASGDSSRHS